MTLTATSVPASAPTKALDIDPLIVTVSLFSRPDNVRVPLTVTAVVVSYTLSTAVKPLIVTGAGVISAARADENPAM